MADLLDFQRDQIIGARIAGACVTKIAELFGIGWCTVLKVMTAFVKGKKNPPHRSKTLEESQS